MRLFILSAIVMTALYFSFGLPYSAQAFILNTVDQTQAETREITDKNFFLPAIITRTTPFNSEKKTISIHELRMIFTGRMKEKNGQRIVICFYDLEVMKTKIFVERVLGLTMSEFRSSLIRNRASVVIVSNSSEQRMREVISTTDNSFGFVFDTHMIEDKRLKVLTPRSY